MLNTLKEIVLNIGGKEYPICCDDWNKLKYAYFLSAIASIQCRNEDMLYKVALYLDYVDNNIWDSLSEKKNKVILKTNMHSMEDFIDEALELEKLPIMTDTVKAYLDYEEVWDDMQAGCGEFKEWAWYPVMTEWGFIALIPR